MYDPFAHIYNDHWGPGFSRRVYPVIERLVLTKIPKNSRILDLACGTGQLAGRLAEDGYRVIGVDSSPEMIRFARSNAPGGEFLVADARAFRLSEPCSAALSVYDSLNHILKHEDLVQTFQQVGRALKVDGIFVFDLNMEEGYRSRWRGSLGIVKDQYALIVRSGYNEDDRIGVADITIFTQDKIRWTRTDFSLIQYCYTAGDVVSALVKAGFGDIQILDAESDLGWIGHPGRSFFLARNLETDDSAPLP